MLAIAPRPVVPPIPPPVLDEASRRRFLSIIAAAGLLGACGAQAEDEVAGSDPDYPRTVRTARGDIELPARPERVVCKYFSSEFDAVYGLGIVPVAVMSGFVEPFPWHDAAVAEIATLAPATLDSVDWNLEAVAAQQPDLIACQDGEYDKSPELLDRIAPCLVLDANVDPSWRADTRLVGEVFASQDEAEALISATEEVIAQARARVVELAGQTVRLLSAFYPTYYRRSASTLLGKLVVELGLVVPDEEDYVEVSQERLAELGGTDLLLVSSYDDALTEQGIASPTFAFVPQVRDGAWARLDASTEAGASTSALSIRYAAPLLADALLSAAGGGAGQRF